MRIHLLPGYTLVLSLHFCQCTRMACSAAMWPLHSAAAWHDMLLLLAWLQMPLLMLSLLLLMLSLLWVWLLQMVSLLLVGLLMGWRVRG